jgi:7,8-dihydropterin-6-yl-methyl-4-(beta-D-ribofuranosyl)aminobenzene 5'-phosphate synthase
LVQVFRTVSYSSSLNISVAVQNSTKHLPAFICYLVIQIFIGPGTSFLIKVKRTFLHKKDGKMKVKILCSFLLLVLLAAVEKTSDEMFTEVKEGTITNLYDAFGKDTSLTKDFGFSCITKYNGKTILFDAGSNADIFKKNTIQLGIDLSQVDIVVVSHGHFDHLNGIDYLLQINPKVKIYFPYDIFWGAPVPFDASGTEPDVKDSLPPYMQYFDGSKSKFTINQSGRFWNANIEFVKTSKEILPGLHLVATSAQFMGYFSCYPGKSFVEGQFEQKQDNCNNTNLPELSLTMKTSKGQVLIAGCSHTGIENIVMETQKVTTDKIELVFGGFHMLPFDRMQTAELATVLKNDLKVHRVAPAHCTGHLAFKILSDTYKNDYLYAGLGERVNF